MKFLPSVLLFLVCFCVTALGQTRQFLQGACEKGNEVVTTSGVNSTTKVQRSYPSCTVTVFDAGTANLASIASDEGGTPKSNPFTADSTGRWNFWALQGRYDVRFSGAGITTPFTLPNQWVVIPIANPGNVSSSGSSTDNALVRWEGASGTLIQNSGVVLSDSDNLTGLGTLNGHGIPAVAADTFALLNATQSFFNKTFTSATNQLGGVTTALGGDATGDTYYRNAGGLLTRLPIGSAGQVLTVTGGIPGWGAGVAPPFIDTTAIVMGSVDSTKRIRFEVDGLTTSTTRVLTVPDLDFVMAGSNMSNAWADNITQTFNPGATAAGINVGQHTADPAGATNGDCYYNSTANELRCRINSVWTALGSGGGGGGGSPGGSNGNIQYRINASTFGGMTGTTVSSLGELLWSPAARTGAAVAYFRLSTPPDTTLSADTQVEGVTWGETATVRQWTAGGGSFNTQREYVFRGPTYAFTSADSIQNVATVAIQNAPTAGTNATFGDSYALWVQAGRTLLEGKLDTRTTSTTLAAIRIGNTTADPSSPLEGDMYYNSSTDKFRCYQNSAWVDCIAAGGGGIGGSITAGQIAFGSGVNTITGELEFTYTTATNTITHGDDGTLATVSIYWDTDGLGNPRYNFTTAELAGGYSWFNNATDELMRVSDRMARFATPARTGNTGPYFQILVPPDTAQTADTEQVGVYFGTGSPVIRQWTAGGGSFSTQREHVFTHPTYAFTSADSISVAATVTITGAPVAGTNATLSDARALWVDSGRSWFEGGANVQRESNLAYALVVDGPVSISHSATGGLLNTIAVVAASYEDLTLGFQDVQFNLNRTVNYVAGGAVAEYIGVVVHPATFTGDGARTITDATTVVVSGPPIASTNFTITNARSLWVKDGVTQFGVASTSTGSIRFAVSGDSDTSTIQGGDAPASTLTYKWPSDDPTAGQVLSATAPSGGVVTLSWETASGGSGCTVAGSQGDYQINSGAGGCAAGVITQGTNGRLVASPTVATSGVNPYFRLVAPADTGQTADTEFPGIYLGGSSGGATVTRTGADGTTYALQREILAPAVTYAFAGATTVTLAVGADFNSPIAGTNATLTNSAAVRANPSATAHLAFLAAHSNTNSTGSFLRGTTGGTTRIDILPFNLGGARVGGWIDMSTTGPSGIGNGGVGSNAWIAYADTVSAYLTDATTGDIVYRNTGGDLLFGTSAGNSTFAIVGTTLGVNKSSGLSATLDIVSVTASVTALQAVSAANSTVDLAKFGLIADDTSTVANLASFNTISNGSAAAGFGQSHTYNLESSTTNDQLAMRMDVSWVVATHADRTSQVVWNLVSDATTVDLFRIVARDVAGGATYHQFFFGPQTATSAVNNMITTTGGSGANAAGSELTLAAGQSTGTGTPGFVAVVLPLRSTSSSSNLNGYGTFAYPVTLNMGSKAATTTVTGTGESDFMGTLTGTDTVGAGEWAIGQTVVMEFFGILSTDGTPGTGTIRVKINGTTQLTLTSTTLPNTATNIPITGRIMVTCRTTGASGAAFIQGYFKYQVSNADQFFQGATTATFTLDTTTDTTFSMTLQFSDTGNSASNTNGLFTLHRVG